MKSEIRSRCHQIFELCKVRYANVCIFENVDDKDKDKFSLKHIYILFTDV